MNHLERALALVRVPSVSRHETELADLIEATLRPVAHLSVDRIGDNVVARTTGTSPRRVIVAGHIDTVPGDASEARIEGDRLWGVGACDMKGSVSVMLDQATRPVTGPVEVTWIFYAKEEISRSESGLLEIARARADLLEADVALLAEPTGGSVEAGCQGTLRIEVMVRGARAHTARPFTGRNAIHRIADVVTRLASYTPRVAAIDGIDYTEQLQVVAIAGGIATNVVPDAATCTLNHRFAPDRTVEEAFAGVSALIAPAIEDADTVVLTDSAPAAPPSLAHDLIARLVDATGSPARAKLGWTDVATFAERGIPAVNYGAGDPLLAHRSDEFVTTAELASFDAGLARFLA